MRSRRLSCRSARTVSACHEFVESLPVDGARVVTASDQNAGMSGRFAPSPTGELHLGNLRTALVAWLAARSAGLGFLVRMEDLDRVTSSPEHERRQLADLAAIGLDWDGEVLRQSDRFDVYRSEIERLRADGRVYECFCTRREIRAEIDAAAHAPHVHLPDGAYPGTCRDLTADERAERIESGRRPALRLRADGEVLEFDDLVHGHMDGAVDDVVLARADGVPAYNLAVVVDDAAQGVTQVCRGDDLLTSTPRQILLQQLLGAATPQYLHVPLVLGPDGQRLAKRHGAVTLAELQAQGSSAAEVVSVLARSLGLANPGETVTAEVLVERFDPATLPKTPAHLADLYRSTS
jgi:glutamyl-tRNA synthetase